MKCLVDRPEDSDIQEFQLEQGDLILLATDGVWDNLYDDEILELRLQLRLLDFALLLPELLFLIVTLMLTSSISQHYIDLLDSRCQEFAKSTDRRGSRGAFYGQHNVLSV
jgi:hypothetical protein